TVGEGDKIKSGLPKFLWGHSMGGEFVTNFILKRNVPLRGAIISSPLFKLAFSPSQFKVFLGGLIKRVFPHFSQNANIDVPAISRNQNVVQGYIEDPLVHSKMSARTFVEVLETAKWVIKNSDQLKI